MLLSSALYAFAIFLAVGRRNYFGCSDSGIRINNPLVYAEEAHMSSNQIDVF